MTGSHRTFLAGVAGIALGLLLIGRAVVATDPQVRNAPLIADMAASVAYDAYAPNPNFADGKTLRPPVAGTVARGFEALRYEATPAGAARAGEELESPFARGGPEVIDRGRRVFQAFCITCHGPAGEGDGPVTKRGVPPPPSLTSERVVGLKDGQLFHVVTYGQGNMASYAGQIDREDRWKVIRFIRSLKEQP